MNWLGCFFLFKKILQLEALHPHLEKEKPCHVSDELIC